MASPYWKVGTLSTHTYAWISTIGLAVWAVVAGTLVVKGMTR